MSDFTIAAEPRTEFGKGAARRLRRASKVPAVLYGHGTDPLHLALPGHETMLALKTTNPLITLTLADGSELALPKHVQRDPLRGFIEHVDFVLVRQGERVNVDVGVHVVGEAAPDTLVNAETTSVTVEAEATNLPEFVEVSVEGLTAGALVHAGDLELPAGVTLVDDPETLIVGIQAAPTAAQMEEGLDENQLPADSATESAGEQG